MNSEAMFYWGVIAGLAASMLIAFFVDATSKRRRKSDDNQGRLDQMWAWFISIERHSLASYSNVGDVRRELQQHIAETVAPKRRKTDKKGEPK